MLYTARKQLRNLKSLKETCIQALTGCFNFTSALVVYRTVMINHVFIKNCFMLKRRAYVELWMHAGSLESANEA